MAGRPKKLVLAVIDSLKPEMLDRAIAEGRAPALKAVVERGTYIRDCVSAYPSVTPVASSSIATGAGPDRHHIASMNWYHRGEQRYVEYGSSFQATRAFGICRSLYDTVYNMNMAHLSRATKTVYEELEDAGLRTACTTFLIYRGRTRHRLAEDGVYPAIARAAQFTHAVYGPTELFYADLFQSRRTGCTSMLGRPGQRDQHTGCVGAHLVEHDLFDFMLFSLPDNDTYSHRYGPYAQVQSIAGADRALERIMHVAGGPDAFLDEHAVIVMSDHSQTPVEDRVNLARALGGWRVLTPADRAPGLAEIAVSPAARSAMVYVLDRDRRKRTLNELDRDLAEVDGLDLVVSLRGEEAAVRTPRGELRFAPGGELEDVRGRRWSVEGELDALDLRVEDGRVGSGTYPDSMNRLWCALTCPNSGDVLISAMPGYEFVDWGGTDHVGGGSHGSLHRGDSLGVLIFAGTGPAGADEPRQWSIEDVTPMVLEHFQS
ncbi:MAG TPA: alkaline phosphatase family protein [Thermoleophilaceae bacterium]|nr:alkaline phosphatase family protein [Thermoleophilaceae bacterium]